MEDPSRILHLVAVWLLLLLGGEEDERDGSALLHLLHRVRGGQPCHAPPLRLHLHFQVREQLPVVPRIISLHTCQALFPKARSPQGTTKHPASKSPAMKGPVSKGPED
jgi:hypothetical protein